MRSTSVAAAGVEITLGRHNMTGWKGRGVWASLSTGSTFHLEGGKGATSEIVQFQIRPDPLAN